MLFDRRHSPAETTISVQNDAKWDIWLQSAMTKSCSPQSDDEDDADDEVFEVVRWG